MLISTQVDAGRPINECRTYVNNAEQGALKAAPPAQACAKLQIDARSAKAERLIGNAQLKTAQAAQDARTDADEAARLLRAYELRRNAEDGETFAVDQLSSPGAIAGVCFRDDVEGDAILGDLRTPLAGYKPDAAWCCGSWVLVKADGLDQYRGALSKRTTASVRVPEGASGGSVLETYLPDGTPVNVILPRGARPGQQLDAPISYARDLSLDVAISAVPPTKCERRSKGVVGGSAARSTNLSISSGAPSR